ncbi:MAG TPA: large conductance mechanosensitive channel protein MscL [Candidatus Thermoplasmatota archaeon]|nr:large conductance mechanosensitive channel protein MscL [Candidatus Thermoplasmatota archaeon]
MGMMHEFREFAVRGNVVDLAIGLVVGTAFGAIVKSFVDDLFMPVMGLALGGVDFANRYWVLKGGGSLAGNETVTQAREGGAVVIAYGQFVNLILTFVIVAWAAFMLVKAVNRLRRPKGVPPGAPTTRNCPRCDSLISNRATRCPNCTSDV